MPFEVKMTYRNIFSNNCIVNMVTGQTVETRAEAEELRTALRKLPGTRRGGNPDPQCAAPDRGRGLRCLQADDAGISAGCEGPGERRWLSTNATSPAATTTWTA